jgi:hypothetical protein
MLTSTQVLNRNFGIASEMNKLKQKVAKLNREFQGKVGPILEVQVINY